MEVILKTNKFALLIGIQLFINHALIGQKLFYCDTLVSNTGMIVSSCDLFFNFFEDSVDSITIFDRNEYDTLFETEIPYYKKDFVTIFIEPECNKCNRAKITYLYKGNIVIQGSLLNGMAEGVFNGHFYDDLTATFHNGKLHGTKTILYRNGKKLVENYRNGVLNGNLYLIDVFGRYLYFCSYQNGKRHGLEYSLYENGMLNYANHYNAGIPIDGVYNKYDGEGILYLQLTIKDGKVIKEDWQKD